MTSRSERASVSRREFIITTGGATLCALSGSWGATGCSGACVSNLPVAPDGSYVREQDRLLLSLTEIEELKPVGGAVIVLVDDSPNSGDHESGVEIVVAKVGEAEYRACQNRCTHKDKELDFLPDREIFRCCSGHSTFELSGEVIEGNATEPLRLYDVQLEEDLLVVLLA